jgi:hypothetical protein
MRSGHQSQLFKMFCTANGHFSNGIILKIARIRFGKNEKVNRVIIARKVIAALRFFPIPYLSSALRSGG